MRNSVIISQFHNFRIDENEFHFIRRGFIQHTHDNRIDAHTLSRTGGTGDEKVRHSLQICNDRISRDIFAHDKTDFRLRLLKIRRFDHLPQSDHRRLLIFHFDAHRRFSRNRRFDPQALRFQIQSDIVGKPDDTVYFYAGIRLDFIPGN